MFKVVLPDVFNMFVGYLGSLIFCLPKKPPLKNLYQGNQTEIGFEI